jgi:hypothetical protein
MSKETKYNVENLPYKLDDKIELIPRRQYMNHKASDLTIRHKVDVKKSAVSDIIDMIVVGKVLDEGNEEQWYKIYDEIKADIELAQTKNAEQIEAANAAAEQKKQQEAEAKEKDAKLVEVANTTDVATVFASLGEHFDLGNMDRCVPKEGTTDETLMSALVAGIKMEEFSNWAKGDLVCELENRGRVNAMVALCESTGIPYKSIYRMAVTARNVPPDKRDPAVGFTTYAEVANARFSKDETKNKEVLAQTIAKIAPKSGDEKKDAGVITTALEARKAVQAAQGKEPPTPADPNAVDLEKHWFAVVDYDARETRAVVGYPKSRENEDGVDIIHLKTARRAYFKGNKLNWTALDEHKEPPTEEEAKAADAAAKKKADAEKAEADKKAASAAAKAKKGGKGKGK